MQNLEKEERENPSNYKLDESKGSTKDWITAKEAANYLGITLMTLSSWVKKGLLTRKKVGGKVYYNKKEVQALTNTKEGGAEQWK